MLWNDVNNVETANTIAGTNFVLWGKLNGQTYSFIRMENYHYFLIVETVSKVLRN